jgi:hypothetical protein
VDGAEGRGEAAGYWGTGRGDMDGPYIPILPSWAADMRASLWTYIISGPVFGPTHPHSHTALRTHRDFPRSIVHCESMLSQPLLYTESAQWPFKAFAPPSAPLSIFPYPCPLSQQLLFDFLLIFRTGVKTRGIPFRSESFRSQTRKARVVTDQPQPRDPQC